MKRRTAVLAGLGLATLLAGSGCVFTNDSADIEFNWTCNGYRCADQGVMTTLIQMDGTESFEVETPIGADGVSLEGHERGDYGYHILGLSPSRVVLFETYGNITAQRGSNTFNVTLTPPVL